MEATTETTADQNAKSNCEVLNPIGHICNETPLKRGQEDYKSQKTRLPAAKTGQGS